MLARWWQSAIRYPRCVSRQTTGLARACRSCTNLVWPVRDSGKQASEVRHRGLPCPADRESRASPGAAETSESCIATEPQRQLRRRTGLRDSEPPLWEVTARDNQLRMIRYLQRLLSDMVHPPKELSNRRRRPRPTALAEKSESFRASVLRSELFLSVILTLESGCAGQPLLSESIRPPDALDPASIAPNSRQYLDFRQWSSLCRRRRLLRSNTAAFFRAVVSEL